MEPPAGIEPASVRPKRTALIPLNYRGREKFWSIVPDLNRRFRTGNAVSLTARRTMLEWSGWTELNCRHEFPGLGCYLPLHHTPFENLVRQQGLEPRNPLIKNQVL